MLTRMSFTNGRCVHSKIYIKGDYCCDFLLTSENIKPLIEQLESLENKNEDYFVFDKIEFEFKNDTLELHYLDRVEKKLTMSEIDELLQILYEDYSFLIGLKIDYRKFINIYDEAEFVKYWMSNLIKNADSLYMVSDKYIFSTELPIKLTKYDNKVLIEIDETLYESNKNEECKPIKMATIEADLISELRL